MSEKKERIITPAAEALYCWLNKPDTKFKDEGQFKVSLILDTTDDAEFIERIEALEREELAAIIKDPKNKKLTLNPVLKPHTDKEGNEVAGKVLITFKTTASGVKDGKEWTRKVTMFDAKGKPVEANVGNGSTLKVSFTAGSYTNPAAKGYGLSLYLEAVQIIDLVEFKSNADAAGYGFGEEEGYSVDEANGNPFPEEGDEPDTNPAPEEDAVPGDPKPEPKKAAPKAAPAKAAAPAPKAAPKAAPKKTANF